MCDLIFLRQAILKAKESVAQGGFPAGSVVVKAGEKVSSIYYAGNYSLANLNVDLLQSIELVHCLELEEESLALVWDWERDKK